MTQPITDELITKLKAAHSDAELNHLSAEIDGDTYEVIAKTPNEGEYKRYREARLSDDTATKAGANKLLLAVSVVHPSKEEWAEMQRRKPGLPDTFAGELMEAAGIARTARRKKL